MTTNLLFNIYLLICIYFNFECVPPPQKPEMGYPVTVPLLSWIPTNTNAVYSI